MEIATPIIGDSTLVLPEEIMAEFPLQTLECVYHNSHSLSW